MQEIAIRMEIKKKLKYPQHIIKMLLSKVGVIVQF